MNTYSSKSHWHVAMEVVCVIQSVCRYANVYVWLWIFLSFHSLETVLDLMAMTFSILSFPSLEIWFFYEQQTQIDSCFFLFSFFFQSVLGLLCGYHSLFSMCVIFPQRPFRSSVYGHGCFFRFFFLFLLRFYSRFRMNQGAFTIAKKEKTMRWRCDEAIVADESGKWRKIFFMIITCCCCYYSSLTPFVNDSLSFYLSL